MKNKKILMNFFYQASYQMLVVLLPIVTVPLVSRALEPSGVGTWNYVNSIVSYFTLVAGLGLSTYGVREIAFVRRNKMALSKKFWEIQFFNMFFSGLVFIVYIIFSLNVRFSTLFLLQSMTIFATLLDVSWFFQGIEDFKKISLVNILVKIVTFVLTISLIRHKSDLALYVAIIGLSSLISGLSFWIFLRGKIVWVKVTMKEIWGHFVPALNFFVVKVASTLFNNLNKTILGLMTTMAVVGIFSNSLVLVMMITTVFNSLNTVLLPRMSSLQQDNRDEEMLDLLGKAVDIQVFMTMGTMFITLGLIKGLVGWFFGSSFAEVVDVVPILVPVMLLASVQQAIANMYLVPKNKIASYTRTIIIGTVINIIICVVLIPKVGAFGAAIGYSVGQLYLAASRIFILMKETTFVPNYKNFGFCLIAGVITYVLTYSVGLLSISGFVLTVSQGVVGVGVYMVATMAFRVNPIALLRK